MSDDEQDGFVEDGPQRAKGYQPGLWNFIWWWLFGPGRSRDDERKLWWRHS